VESASVVSEWRLPHEVSSGQSAYFSRLAKDNQGGLHLIYTENVPTPDCPICYHLFHRRSDTDGLSWSNLVDISNSPTGSAKPQIVIDKQGYIHVVWEAGLGGDVGQLIDPTKVMYAASYDQGKTWTSPVEFIAPHGIAKNIALGLDGQNRLVVAWLGMPEDLVYYQVSGDQGHSWSPPQSIPGIWGGYTVYQARLDAYTMATDSAGDIHLALVGRTASDQKSLSVLHLRWDGSAWSRPEVVATLTNDVAEWPRLAIGNGNQLHLVWFVRDAANIWGEAANPKPNRVWYARGVSSSPPVAPMPWPTRTPTPLAKATVSPPPTSLPTLASTPTPSLDPGLAQASVPALDSIYTDMDELMLLVKSLIPVALVVAAVVIGAHFRRR
jgi:hypothetical protein